MQLLAPESNPYKPRDQKVRLLEHQGPWAEPPPQLSGPVGSIARGGVDDYDVSVNRELVEVQFSVIEKLGRYEAVLVMSSLKVEPEIYMEEPLFHLKIERAHY